MEEIKYKCKHCNREFDEEEFKLTNDKNKCILHCENKDNPNVKSLFWKVFIEKYEEKNINHSFFPKMSLKIKDIFFPEFDGLKGISFFNIKESIIFENCIFYSKINIHHITGKNSIEFNYCSFMDDIYLYENFIESKEKSFSPLSLKFKEVKFFGSFLLKKDIDFEMYLSDSYLSREFKVDNVSFKNKVYINNCYFNKLWFNDVIFYDDVFFNKIKISDTYTLDNTSFFSNYNLFDLSTNIKGRKTAQMIKNSNERQNNIIEANKFYALEMKEREKELNLFNEPFEWLVFKIHGLASNHSQNWILSLFWIINITFLANFFSYEFTCDSDVLKSIDRSIFFVGGLVAIGYGITRLKEKYINLSLFVFSIFSYFLYSNLYFDDGDLKEFSNMINPFSIMTKGEDLDFPTMIYKIIIAYLIYQLIISIRQNTRRK